MNDDYEAQMEHEANMQAEAEYAEQCAAEEAEAIQSQEQEFEVSEICFKMAMTIVENNFPNTAEVIRMYIKERVK